MDCLAVRQNPAEVLDQIISMDYLVENVIGSIPQYEDLSPMGKATVDTAGVESAQSTSQNTEEAEEKKDAEAGEQQ